MKLLRIITLFVFLACATICGADVRTQLVATDSDSEHIWIIWTISRTDDELMFVRGHLASASPEAKGLFSGPIAYVRLDAFKGSLMGLTSASEKIPAMPVSSFRLYGPEGLHEIPKDMHHGPMPIAVACSILREPLVEWVRAHSAVERVVAEFNCPTLQVGERVEETSRPVILSAELLVSADRSELTVDIPEIRIDFPPLDLDADAEAEPGATDNPDDAQRLREDH